MISATYIALDDPHDIAAWSGTPYFIARALEAAGFSLEYAGPFVVRNRLWYKFKSRFYRLRGWDYALYSEENVLRNFARQVERQLLDKKGKILLSCGAPHLSRLNTKLPIIFFDDGSVQAISSAYEGFKNLHPEIKAKLLRSERRILDKCFAACYMSHWAAEAALKEHGRAFESKIKVLPLGPNLEHVPTEAEVENAIAKRDGKSCHLLMAGIDWKRKGGPIALATAEELHRRGVPVILHILGCTPPVPVPDYVKIHGFVSKKTEKGKALVAKLYQESHFLILPTRAEAYGLAFVEASANGVPSLGTALGGVQTIVRENENGWLLPFDATPSQYSDRIQSVWSDPATYTRFCRLAFRSSQTRLSWNQFGQTVVDLAHCALDQAQSRVTPSLPQT